MPSFRAEVLLYLGLAATCGGFASCGAGGQEPSSAQGLVRALGGEQPSLPAVEDVRRTLSDASREWAALAEEERGAVAAYRANPGPAAALALGRLYAQAENFELARAFLLPVLAAAPEQVGAWVWLGVERIGAERPEEAELLLAHALELDPDQALAHRALGGLLLEAGRPQAARGHLERAVELDPTAIDAALDLGRLMEEAGELERAGEVLERARRADPLNPSVLFLLARVRRGEGRKLEAEALERRHARAIAIDDLGLRGAELSPQRVALALGIHYVGSGQAELALEEFDTAAGRGGDGEAIGMALGGRVDALLRLGRLAEARAGLEELRQFDARHGMLDALEAALEAAAEPSPTPND
jgi:Tfp pilus assembly protein PilF